MIVLNIGMPVFALRSFAMMKYTFYRCRLHHKLLVLLTLAREPE